MKRGKVLASVWRIDPLVIIFISVNTRVRRRHPILLLAKRKIEKKNILLKIEKGNILF